MKCRKREWQTGTHQTKEREYVLLAGLRRVARKARHVAHTVDEHVDDDDDDDGRGMTWYHGKQIFGRESIRK